MDDLNERAAKAMGWQIEGGLIYEGESREMASGTVPHYTTDANACRELLAEVERRGLQSEFDTSFYFLKQRKSANRLGIIDALTAPLENIVRSAVEVLEADNG